MNSPWKEGHSFILDRAAIQRQHAEVQEICGFYQLRKNGAPIVGGVAGIIHHGPVILSESDKPRVFDPIALVGGHRKDNALAESQPGGESQFIIGVREPLDELEGAPLIVRGRHYILADAGDAGGQLAAGELFGQGSHHRRGAFVIQAHLLQFNSKPALPVAGVRHHFRHRDKTRNRSQGNPPLRRNNTIPELYGGNVSLAGRPQAHDKTQPSFQHPRLVRMSHDGRVEKRGGFQGILPGK